jgi:hypothetical protein
MMAAMGNKTRKEKPVIVEIPAGTEFKASDAKKAAGLSYRQLNDWSTKGALADGRDSASWRRFSPRKLFALSVCAQIRTTFSVPLDRLSWLKTEMLKGGRDYFKFTVEKMTEGRAVWLLTDLSETLLIDPDSEFEDLFANGYFRDDSGVGYIFINVNDVANRILGCLKNPVKLKLKKNA